MKTIKDLNIDNKKVIIRCDFNVPMKDGKITDNTRIVGALETIQYALDHHCKIILLSHLGAGLPFHHIHAATRISIL